MYQDRLSHRILFLLLARILYCQQLTRHQIFHESNVRRKKRASTSISARTTWPMERKFYVHQRTQTHMHT